jgi:hypothetical protein
VPILTFAILFSPSVVLLEEIHLGENHQKRAIPAGHVEGIGKKKTRHDGGPHRITDWVLQAPLENTFVLRRHTPGDTP